VAAFEGVGLPFERGDLPCRVELTGGDGFGLAFGFAARVAGVVGPAFGDVERPPGAGDDGGFEGVEAVLGDEPFVGGVALAAAPAFVGEVAAVDEGADGVVVCGPCGASGGVVVDASEPVFGFGSLEGFAHGGGEFQGWVSLSWGSGVRAGRCRRPDQRHTVIAPTPSNSASPRHDSPALSASAIARDRASMARWTARFAS